MPRTSPPLRRLAAAALLATMAASGCGRAPESPLTEERLASLTTRQKAAQLVVARIPPGPRGEAAARRAVDAGMGGILLTGGEAADAAALVDTLRARSALPLLVAAELDRGVGGALRGATELPPPGALGFAAGPEDARDAAEAVAREAREVGIGLALVTGPSLDPDPLLSLRDPRAPGAAEATVAFAQGLQRAGIPVVVRAFPARPRGGDVPVLDWDRAALEAVQLGFLRRMRENGVGAVLLAPVTLPALTGDSTPLPLSPVAIQGVARRDLGFEGPVAAGMGAGAPLTRRHGPAETAVRAVAAGADLLVDVWDPAGTVDALEAAVRSGRIPPARLDEAVRRVWTLKQALPAPPPARAPGPLRLRTEEVRGAAIQAHRRALLAAGDPAAALRACRAVALASSPTVADELLVGLLAARGPRPHARIRADTVALRGPVVRGDTAAAGPDCLVVARFGAEGPIVVERLPGTLTNDTLRADSVADTAAADTAAPAPVPPRRVIELAFLAPPRPGAEPGPALVAWGVGEEAQRAAAAVLAADAEAGPLPASMAWPPAPTLRSVEPEAVGMSAKGLERVDSVLRAAVAEGVFPGAAVAIGRRGGLVRLRGYGRVDAGEGAPRVDARETVFDLASLTKVVGTTAAAMTLVASGDLDLDEPVRRTVPAFRGDGRGDVTIRQLLTHTSGLSPGSWLYGSARSPEDALARVERARLVNRPGSKGVYSDYGMILLAEAVRRRAGRPMDELLAEQVFAPLGMASTFFLPPLPALERTAVSATENERPYAVRGVVHDANAFRLGGVAGHAGLFSTAEEVAVFAQTLLNGGAYGPRRIWPAETVRAFTTAQEVPGERALGWDVPGDRSSAGDYFSARSFGHTGFTGTSLWIDPEKELFVVLLAHRTYADATSRDMLRVRQGVHDAAARAITDVPVKARPGTRAAAEEARLERLERQRQRRTRRRG